jgi:putative endopeptidase
MTVKLLCAASILALSACASNAPVATTKMAEAKPTEMSAAAKPKPEIGTWGFDSAGMDASVKPGNSFYNFANGTWVKNTPIPEDKSNYGMFNRLSDRSDERTRAIIEAAAASKGMAGSEAQKVGDYYAGFMDEAAIEAAGIAPIQADLDRIAAIKDSKGIAAEFARSARLFGGNPFTTYVAQDERNPETHIGNLTQGGLGLPDQGMYDPAKGQFAANRDGYKKYITDMFTLAGVTDSAKRSVAVYALEEKMAAVHWTRLENRNPQKTYNKMTIAELQKMAPGVDWAQWTQDVGLGGQTSLNVAQPSAIAAMAKMVASQPVGVWKDYLTLRLLNEAAPYLPKAYVDTNFAFYGKTLSGTPQQRVRWKRGVAQVTDSLGEAVGKLYVEKHFTADTKANADALVKNLLTAMGQRLDTLSWMSAETKVKAKEKLATYNPKIGFPKEWRDYSKLDVRAGDPVGNATRAAAFEYNRLLAKLGQPVDRNEWGMTPMTVNAYYNPVLNEIVFPAAILQPPFFDPHADPAVNYGGIGAVIGHEISHGFDDQGSQYDSTGTLKNWWTKEDLAKFKVATDQLVAQYDSYCPFPATAGKPAQCVKGALTLGENIADLAGLTIAYQAYKISLGGTPAPVIDGMTGDQRFYLGWAQVWRRSYRDKELQNRLVTDVHAPSENRVSVVRNLDPWYAGFSAAAGETLYLDPEKRVKIW